MNLLPFLKAYPQHLIAFPAAPFLLKKLFLLSQGYFWLLAIALWRHWLQVRLGFFIERMRPIDRLKQPAQYRARFYRDFQKIQP